MKIDYPREPDLKFLKLNSGWKYSDDCVPTSCTHSSCEGEKYWSWRCCSIFCPPRPLSSTLRGCGPLLHVSSLVVTLANHCKIRHMFDVCPACASAYVCKYMCVCVWVKENECDFWCDRQSVCVRARAFVCGCVRVYVSMRRDCVYVIMCVCVCVCL